MGHIAAAMVQLDPSQTERAESDVYTAGLGGTLSAALAGVISYLAGALQSLNPAVKLEAGRVLLRMSSASERWSIALGLVDGTRAVFYCDSCRGVSAWQDVYYGGALPSQRLPIFSCHPGRSLPPLSPLRLASTVPPAVAASAISALLELKERLLVEAALAEVISLVAGHLDVLLVGGV